MSEKYVYYWDAVSKKKRYGGKYGTFASGYYGNNNGGDAHELKGGGNPDKRKFVGPGIDDYVFDNEKLGTHTIPAHNFEEALRRVKAMGYKRSDFKEKRKRGK